VSRPEAARRCDASDDARRLRQDDRDDEPAAKRVTGLLDLTVTWAGFRGDPSAAATLSRLGPVTASQARKLALLAALDPHSQWRLILTDADGRAIAVERIRRRPIPQPRRPPGVTGRVTIVMREATLDASPPPALNTQCGIEAAILRAARRAKDRAARQRAADTAAGECAHTAATAAYRPPPRIRELVEARDRTCRQPTCRQPAAHADLDHTVAHHKGGLTCPCNLGGRCRTHHKIKQEPGWILTQPRPGYFEITTPAGRTYVTEPDVYPT
jgi:hypothetical protein